MCIRDRNGTKVHTLIMVINKRNARQMGGPVSFMRQELFVFKGVWLHVILLNGLPTGVNFISVGSQYCSYFTWSVRAFPGHACKN